MDGVYVFQLVEAGGRRVTGHAKDVVAWLVGYLQARPTTRAKATVRLVFLRKVVMKRAEWLVRRLQRMPVGVPMGGQADALRMIERRAYALAA